MSRSKISQVRTAETAPPTLAFWLREAARRVPEACAVQALGHSVSYAELLTATDALASRLRAQGFVAGDRIGIAAVRSIDTIVSILAVIDAGLGYVPLDLNYPADRLQAMLEDAAPRAVLGERDALARLGAAVGEFPTINRPAPPGAAPHAATADLSYVLFTSGSTGRPKGVAMGATPLRHLILWHAQHARLGQASRVLQFAPLSFDVHFQEIFSTLACAGTLVLLPDAQRRDPVLLLAALNEHRVERIFVPFVALQMIADAARDKVPVALRDVVSAGEQLQVTPAIRSMFARLPGAELHNHYGPTESHVVTAFELRGNPAEWPEIPPIGLPLPHVRLLLHNAQRGSGDGSSFGELLIGGETLAQGYLGRPELTVERFRTDFEGLPDRWYMTGDLVRRDADGTCAYLGRADQQLKVDGFRIEPAEIELAMMAHPAVKDAVVTAPELPGVGKQLVAHIVLREGTTAGVAGTLITQLRMQLRGGLPEYMIPVRFVVLEHLPLTPSGKINRRALPLPEMESTATASTDPLDLTRSLWQELLGLPQIGDEQNLFDLGARSLLVMRFVTRLKDLGIKRVTVADVYDHPTVAGIASALHGLPEARKSTRQVRAPTTAGIAIVGMATRTPGAADVDAFWQNLMAGLEGIRHFAPHEIDPSVPESLKNRPNFVAAHGVLENADRFDAAYFGISAREATVLDPQQRLMLELCVSALEHAAIDSSRVQGRIGVYAGTGNNAYAPALRHEQPELVHQYGEFASMLASEKDYVATRVANRLNLSGPALSIQTACSTSLVAVAQAWHALASNQCDVALAGGVNIVVPQNGGYLHVEGGMESADGHCRPFDAGASGTVFASGGGVVVLRRLEDAVASGDTIYAVIRGVGLNNDGGDKASFTAPSVSGQAGAIRMALEHAQVNARSIGYVEAHGTGTSLGDPIEIAALTRAWREDTADSRFCGIGSVKSNLGHMAAGAGVVGLIKAALSLHREVIPRTLHYDQPNPRIDFANTPFEVIAINKPWPRAAEARRAAISSFGVGGTNAHVVIEEAPAPSRREPDRYARLFVLPLSAQTSEATLHRARDLADHLERNPDLPMADVAATLMRGRKPMAHRLSVAASGVADAVFALRAVKSSVAALQKPRLVFMFPGQGSQHPGMARQLYDEAPAFREALDRSLTIAQKALGVDLRHWLTSADPTDATLTQTLAETRYAQPALFSVSYALAAWLDSLGLKADAMIGHSIGEYAAACHAGVFSLEDALAAVLARGQAMFEQPRGAMLAVRAGADTLQTMLPLGVEIAGCNAPALTVVAGNCETIDAFAKQLEAQGIGTTRLRVSHAFHSASMEGALPRVAQALQRALLKAPAATVYSCISGAPLLSTEATDPQYWARQVRLPVQFSRALMAELARGDAVFVEVGPGQALTALLRQHRTTQGVVPRNVALMGSSQDPGNAAHYALSALGALWCAGVEMAWPVAGSAQRLPLPTYPFKGERYWFARRTEPATARGVVSSASIESSNAIQHAEIVVTMSRIPTLETELKRVLSDVSGLSPDEMPTDGSFVGQGLDSLSLTQATLEIERVFGVKLRFRRLLEDLDNVGKLARFLDGEMSADKFAPAAPAAAPAVPAMPTWVALPSAAAAPYVVPATALVAHAAGLSAIHQLIQQQMQLMAQQLAVLSGQSLATVSLPAAPVHAVVDVAPAAAAATATATNVHPEPAQPSIKSLVEMPFGASPRLTLQANQDFTPAQRRWLDDFITRYNARSGKSKAFSQRHRKVMADPRVVTGFNPLWKDLVYPIVADRSNGARLWDLDGNEYIDLLSCFGANLLGYQPPELVQAMVEQLQNGIELGPQHPLAAEVAELISEFTGMERVAFCNTGSEAVVGALRIARTVTGRNTVAIFTNSYHGIVDEVIVRGSKQLRSLVAAPGIPPTAVEHMLVLDYASDDSLRILRERGPDLAAIMIEPIQNKYPTLQPRAFVQSLREIADAAGCALIFDECVTGFRVAPGGAQEFYGVRGDLACYGKIIGGGLPFSAIAGSARWMDALDGGHWQYGDDSYPEAGVTYFAGTFVRHPLALAAARASLLHLKRGGRELYRKLNERTTRLVERLNTAFAVRGAPVKAVHCASMWRLAWDDNLKFVSLFYYLVRFHGLHLYEQFGHFVTEAIGDAETDRIFEVFTNALDELMALDFIPPRPGVQVPALTSTSTESSGPTALAPGQTERWLAGSFDRWARRALNESFCVSLRGPVDLPALKTALQDVLMRHDALRVYFDLDQPLQSLAARAPVPLAEIDLRHLADADRALDSFCAEAGDRDFPVDQAPLAAVSLLHLADGRTVVHMVASHLIFDGWASSVFNAELAAAYRARSAGEAPVFIAAAEPLVFAAREQAHFEGADGQESLAYWRRVLSNPPAPLALGDLTPPTPRQYAADTVRERFDGALLEQLRGQARRSGATLFQWLLTAITMMLRQRSGRDEFVVGLPYAAQGLGRHGPLLADGVLDLPLRLGCAAGDSGATVLARVKNQLMDALEHPLMTQGTAARALGLRSEGNRPALTGIFFNLNPKVDLSGWAPLDAGMHEGRKRGLLSELFFNFYEQQEAITLDLHHSSEHFSAQRARELVDDLKAVCVRLAASMTEPLAAAAALPGVEIAAMPLDPRLLAWNATDAPPAPHGRIEAWVASQAASTPQAPAVRVGNRTQNYGELEARANRYAQVLRARGIGPGMLVGLCLSRGIELLPALLGVLKTGAAYVPLDPAFPPERLRDMAEDAALSLVVTEAVHAPLTGLPRERQLRVDDDAAALAAAPETAPPRATAGDDPAYVIYTSGSTGKPKGVVVPQRAVCNFLASMRREPGLQARDRLLAVTTLSFDIAVLELLLPLVSGASVVLAAREDAMDGAALAGLIATHGVTVMQATPTTWHLLLDAGWRAPEGFHALCGGEPLPPSLAVALRRQGLALWNLYGPTETTVWSTLARIDDASQKLSIGRPIANTQVWILDEALQPCPVGSEGEICIGGDGVASGYLKRPELSAERFVTLGFGPRAGQRAYRTGDLGRWREDGQLEHLGRLDFQVKLRGYRIELGEIEARLEQSPAVARAVVVAHELAPGDLALVGYVVPQAGAALDTAALRESLRNTLPDYMLPRTLLTLAALPLLPNGKIDRKSLPMPALATPATIAASVVPATSARTDVASDELTLNIATHMGQLLGRGPLAPDEHFFELGGHSLMAAKLSAALAAALGHRPGLRAIFESPTPARLAAMLRRAMQQALGAPPAQTIPVLSDRTRAPLSQMQQRVWFLENLTPGTVVHSIPTGHRLTGPLDVEAFDKAFRMLVQRQSVLRTVVERTPTGDIQRVLEGLPFSLLPVDDLSHLPEAERKPAMNKVIAQLVEVPYDLEKGPLFTARLFRLSAEEHGLLFQAHHLIWDAWSFDLLYVDLPELYAACLEKREPKLPPLTVSYGDFSAWHNDWMSGPELVRQTSYWRDKLTPLPPVLELPIDRPRPEVMSGRGGSFQFNLAKDVTDALRVDAQKHGRTLYVTLLSAYALALQRTTRQHDFVIGTPVRGREQPALEPLMGFFVNMLPLRMQFSRDMRLGEWLEAVHAKVVDSFSYPDVPFDHLVRELNVPRDSSRPPIHQVSFSYQDVRERTLRWGNVDHARMPTPMLGAAQDLSLWCVETRNHIEFVFTFNADVLETPSVARFAQRLEALLRQIMAEPDRRLSEYALLTPVEQASLKSWNETEVDYDRQARVHSLITAQCSRSPNAVALSQPGEGEVRYDELEARANRLAHLLRTRGVGRGALVGLCLERGIDMVVAQLAILKTGAAYVPLDPAYPADRLNYMASDARLALLVARSDTLQAVRWPRAQTLLLDIDAAAIASQADTALPAETALDARAEDPAYVIYTSGSTGKPKGVVVPHRAVVNFLLAMAREPGLVAGDRMMAVTTLSFDIAVLELLLPLTVGAEVILPRREEVLDGNELRALLESSAATVMQATPSTWRLLLDAGWAGGSGFKALVGGEGLPTDLARLLLDRCGALWNMYGPTETTVWSTCWKVEQPERGIAIGRPIANTRVHVLDPEGQLCPVGVGGEIFIGGEGLALGYLYRPELTAERFVPDRLGGVPGARLYASGDLGRWRDDGQLEHLGRRDFQVKVRGHRIELGEIESALASHEAVSRCVALSREDVPGDVRLVAYVVTKGSMPAASSLRDHLRASLPDYMLPQHFVQIASVPLLPNGKIDRAVLPRPADTLTAANDHFVAPSNAAERAIADIWKQLLSIEQVGVTDNFFDLGGHSLLAMRAVTEIKNRLGLTLNVRRLIFETLGQIAASAAAPAGDTSHVSRGLLNRLFGRRAK